MTQSDPIAFFPKEKAIREHLNNLTIKIIYVTLLLSQKLQKKLAHLLKNNE